MLFGAVEGDANDGGGAGAAVVGGGGDFDWGGRVLGRGDGRSEVFVEIAAGGGRLQSGWEAVIKDMWREVKTAGDWSSTGSCEGAVR